MTFGRPSTRSQRSYRVHEAKLVRSIVDEVDLVARRNSASTVTVIRIEIGARSHVTSQSLKGQFEVMAQGSLAQDADLDITLGTDAEAPDAADVRVKSILIEDA
jgi:hydrogenase nickel incorporation protein HypA/HybF